VAVDEDEIVAQVVKFLQEYRKKQGITVYRLAQDSGLSISGIRHMESGKVNPSLSFLLRISSQLNIDLSKIIFAAQNGKTPKF
jgi:transcriptional regulator with XRE-family HTH domain